MVHKKCPKNCLHSLWMTPIDICVEPNGYLLMSINFKDGLARILAILLSSILRMSNLRKCLEIYQIECVGKFVWSPSQLKSFKLEVRAKVVLKNSNCRLWAKEDFYYLPGRMKCAQCAQIQSLWPSTVIVLYTFASRVQQNSMKNVTKFSFMV